MSAARCATGWGESLSSSTARVERPSPHPRSLRVDPPPPGEGKKIYIAAVVTPPSTTMVWPVMKVEASEAR